MRRWSWLIPFVVAVALYLPTLDAGLIWDDEIVQKRQLVAFESVHDVFFPPDGIQEWARAYYRPLVLATYLMDRRFYGSERFVGHHFTNVLIHAVVSAFVLLLMRRLLSGYRYGEWGALAAGVIFAVHPIHVESISPIMGRSDTLAAAFMLPSIILALRYRDRPRAFGSLAAAPLLFLCALLSKEVAISTLLLVPALFVLVPRVVPPTVPDKTRSSKKAKKSARRVGSLNRAGGSWLAQALRWIPLGLLYLVATAIYFKLRGLAGSTTGAALPDGIGGLLARGCRAVAYYAVKVFIPAPQSAFVTLREMPSLPLGVAAILVVVGCGVLGVWLWRRGNATVLIACTWLIATMAPSMVIAVRKVSEQPVAERYLYLPSAAVALLIGAGLCWALTRRRLRMPVIAATAIVAGLYGGQTLARSRVWHDNIAFWTDTTAKAPRDGLPIYQLGLAFNRAGTYDKALDCFSKSLKLYDDAEGKSLALNSIGTIHRQRNDEAAAERSFLAAIGERRGYATPYFNLGALYAAQAGRVRRQTGKPDLVGLERICQFLSNAVRLSPSYVKAQFLLAQQTVFLADAHLLAGSREKAQALFSDARERVDRLRKYDAGGEYGRRAAQLLPTIDQALEQLAAWP